MKRTFIVGTRGSQLALTQTKWVIKELQRHYPNYNYEIYIVKTQGDIQKNAPLEQIGGKGVFVKDIQMALLDGKIDFAVHSMKDVPARLPDGLTMGAIPIRENPQDVLISKDGLTLEQLPKGAKVGTSSLRRILQVKRARPDIDTLPIRGNIDTRIKKMLDGEYDAIILAAAGIHRYGNGYEDKITQYLPLDRFIPAVSQAALGIEVGVASQAEKMVKVINHKDTATAVGAERAFLRQLNGNCKIPIAAYAQIKGTRIILSGAIAKDKDSILYQGIKEGHIDEYESIGSSLANELIEKAGITLEQWLDMCQKEGK